MTEMTTKESVWFDQGWAACEEHIIKLLEADICKDWTYSCCDGWCSAHMAAIALIKGEK